jgi:hypothetical protein
MQHTLLSLLVLYFSREGFITVFKVVFFNSFIFPAIIIGLSIFIFNKKIENRNVILLSAH